MEQIKITLNGIEMTGDKGETILNIAKKNGVDIPNLCYNETLKIYGACSLCVVEIEGMPKLETLNALVGGYINMEYQLPNGSKVKFLDDSATYLGNQLESTLVSGRCFGIAANADFILVCTYEENGENPELIVYKKR